MELVIVERTMKEAMTLEAVIAAQQQNRGCHDLRNVRHLRSYVSGDGRRIICIFEGPDAASVRDANEQAGAPFDRVWTGTVVP